MLATLREAVAAMSQQLEPDRKLLRHRGGFIEGKAGLTGQTGRPLARRPQPGSIGRRLPRQGAVILSRALAALAWGLCG